MKITKFLVAFLIIAISFTACGKKKASEKADTKKVEVEKKVEKKVDKKADTEKKESPKEAKALTIKKSKASNEQIKKLSEIFAYGDKLAEERKNYQKEIYELSREFKNLKTPFLLKKDSKYKYVKVNYFSNSMWVTIYPTEKKVDKEKLFWIIISYRDQLSDILRKSYRKKFAGYPASHSKDNWAWILLKGDIEFKISATAKSVKSDKAMEEVFNMFDIKGIESIFNKKTKYPKLKKYLLKYKEINTKITVVNNKFKEKEKEAVEAIKPFLTNEEGILKGYDLNQITFSISNTFLISVKKDKKSVFMMNIGRPSALGVLFYLNNKKLLHSKIGDFDATTVKDSLVMVKLNSLAVKASVYFKTEFKNAEKLREAVASIDLEGLAKVK